MSTSKEPKLGFFQRYHLRWPIYKDKRKTHQLVKAQPPAYNTLATSIPQAPSAPRTSLPDIQARDIPKWTWSNAQCRRWFERVLIDLCGRDVSSSREMAAQFVGFGPNLYGRTFEAWRSLLGQDGIAIYGLLLGYSYEKEAEVPRELRRAVKM